MITSLVAPVPAVVIHGDGSVSPQCKRNGFIA